MATEKSKYFEPLALMVAAGESIAAAADAVGAANSTSYRLAKLPEFQHRVNAIGLSLFVIQSANYPQRRQKRSTP